MSIIKPGSVWIRKSDGQEVIVLAADPSSWFRGEVIYMGKRRTHIQRRSFFRKYELKETPMSDPIDYAELRQDAEFAKPLTGTYEADASRHYYPAMDRIFDAVPALLDENERLRVAVQRVRDVLGPRGLPGESSLVGAELIRRALDATP